MQREQLKTYSNSLREQAFPRAAPATVIPERATKYSGTAGVRHERDVQTQKRKFSFETL
jgi:hypothetical protein